MFRYKKRLTVDVTDHLKCHTLGFMVSGSSQSGPFKVFVFFVLGCRLSIRVVTGEGKRRCRGPLRRPFPN